MHFKQLSVLHKEGVSSSPLCTLNSSQYCTKRVVVMGNDVWWVEWKWWVELEWCEKGRGEGSMSGSGGVRGVVRWSGLVI